MTLNTPHLPTDHGGLPAQKDDRSGARCLVELGWGAAQAEAWLTDSVTLSQMPLGSAATAVGEQSMTGRSGTGALELQVYRELEVLERQTRARILHEVTGRLARQSATGGAAGLALVMPSAPGARDLVVDMLQREGRRAKSERLHGAIRALGARVSPDSYPADAPLSISEALCRTARLLMPGHEANLADAEVQLAVGRADAAHAVVCSVVAALPPTQSGGGGVEPKEDSVGDPEEDTGEDTEVDTEVDTEEEAALRERCLRLLALIAFERGEPAKTLELLGALPLVLDRSASMGALRAAADYRLRKSEAAKASSGSAALEPMPRDEFTVPIGPDERRRVARFLAFAHANSDSRSSWDEES